MAEYSIAQEVGPRACVVTLSGDIDMSVVPELRDSLDSALGSGCANIVLDLKDVAYTDSSALGLFVWLDHRLAPRGGRLVLAGANRDVTRVLELSGLVSVAKSIAMSPDITAALERLDLPAETSDPLWEQTLEVSSDADLLSDARERVTAVLEPLSFPESALFDIKVALGEALANSIRHGQPEQGEAQISVRVIAYGDRAVLEVHDNGPGFDGIHSGSDDVYAPNGRGVMFMNALMDRVEYAESATGGTLVRMTKHRPSDR
jgi:anti-anti-sigma factor